MTTTLKKVAILGAGGALGKYVYDALVHAEFEITVVSRPESTAAYAEGVRVVRVPYTLEGFKEAFTGQDAVASVVGIAAAPDQIAMIDAAAAVGVKRFVPSYFGYEYGKERLPDLESYGAPKFQVLQHAEAVAAKNSGFTFTSIATGAFLDWAIKRFPAMGFDLEAKTATIVDDGNYEFTGTNMHHIGQAVAGCLANPGPSANRHLKVRSLQTSQHEILAALERGTGQSWTRTTIEGEQLLEEGRAKMAAGNRAGILDLLRVQLFGKNLDLGMVAEKSNSDNAIVGIEEEDVDTMVGRILDVTKLLA